ncbi:hypothetical protein [Pseudonocardia acidicola]|uniref:Uncharacterized protein n=1 Tax=Pseudonocardia acidicola TaxID=2724939 RepID=A0ABX1SHE3_9PSEU|nr:hypothetical protein [Pseudonocardia acidicola]NMI00501.1 hypothetical protein [Pseudonocardia acidicola]
MTGPADRAAPRRLAENPGPAREPDEHSRVYWFVGGPLDGRVRTRPASEPAAPSTVRHVHLHDGPKIVHEYDLHEVAGYGGEYRLRDD